MTPEKLNKIVLKFEGSRRLVFAIFLISFALLFSISLWPKEPVLLVGLCQIFLIHILGLSFFSSIALFNYREIKSAKNVSKFWFGLARAEEWAGAVLIFIMLILLVLSLLTMTTLFIYEYI